MSKTLYERLKESRKNLKLSQEYVAKVLGIHRTTVTAIESGVRKVSADELKMFSELYGVSINELMYEEKENDEVKLFARTFSELSENDKKEILNLMEFKKKVKQQGV